MELKARIDHEFLPFVTKPARYLGNEYNSVHKDPGHIRLRIALCFADIYDIGICHPGFEVIYHALNQQDGVWAERIYAPADNADSILRRNKIPLFSLESKSPLDAFQVVLFYVPFPASLLDVVVMIHLGGIPLQARERSDSAPLLVATGPGLSNPEPVAESFDAILTPESGRSLLALVEGLAQHGKSLTRADQLAAISNLDGAYLPSRYAPEYNSYGDFQGMKLVKPMAQTGTNRGEKPARQERLYTLPPLVPITDAQPPGRLVDSWPVYSPTTPAEVLNRFNGEFLSSPQRSLWEKLLTVNGRNDAGKLDLVATGNVQLLHSYWTCLKEKALMESKDIRFSFQNDSFSFGKSITPGQQEMTALHEIAAITPLAGSGRLRSVLNVNIRDEEIVQLVSWLEKRGWNHFQLTFLVGIPTEREEDLLAIPGLVKRCINATSNTAMQWSVFVKSFRPLPQTPLQWEKQESISELTQKHERLRALLKDIPARLSFDSPAEAVWSTVVSRGDRRMFAVLCKLALQPGGINWTDALQEAGMTLFQMLAPVSISTALPWKHISEKSPSWFNDSKVAAYEARLNSAARDLVNLCSGMERKAVAAVLARGNPAGTAHSGANLATMTEEPIRFGRKGKKREAPVANIKKKIRIRYSKTSYARYLTTLDVVRVFARSATLGKIPLVYSQGTKKLPKIAYGPPIPHGITSTAEYLDMEVMIGQETDLQNRFNEFLPNGMQILQFSGIHNKVPSLSATINRFIYEVHLNEFELPQDWITGYLAQDQVWVDRQVKEEVRSMDIRSYITDMSVGTNKLLVTIDLVEGKTTRITEVLDSLLTPQGVDYRQFLIHRTGQFIVQNGSLLTPFDLI